MRFQPSTHHTWNSKYRRGNQQEQQFLSLAWKGLGPLSIRLTVYSSSLSISVSLCVSLIYPALRWFTSHIPRNSSRLESSGGGDVVYTFNYIILLNSGTYLILRSGDCHSATHGDPRRSTCLAVCHRRWKYNNNKLAELLNQKLTWPEIEEWLRVR